MKKIILIAIAAVISLASANAQVENCALQLTADGKVECGVMPELNGITSFTTQLWISPAAWSGTPLQRGNMKVELTGTNNIAVTAGGLQVDATGKGTGQWQQITIVNQRGNVMVLVDGKKVASKSGAEALDNDSELVLGEGYEGLIDEVRIWNSAITAQYGYFWNNTLNEFNDLVPNLMVYYKMDHEEWNGSLVDYKSLWSGSETNHHGRISGGTFVKADNAKLPYLLNGAYTANERFYDRKIEREAYLLSNDIINLGIVSYTDGHLEYSSPCNHGTLQGTATVLPEFEGRNGVLSLDGNGYMETPKTTLSDASNYTIEGWIYIDEWVEGSTILRKGEVSGNNGFSISLGENDGKWLIVKASGESYAFKCGAVSGGRGKPTVDALPVQEWVYVGLSVNGNGTVSGTYILTCNGTTVPVTAASSVATGKYEILGVEGQPVVLGEGFKGKMDQWAVFNMNYSASDMTNHSTNYMMPGIKKLVTSLPMQKANAMYLFDDAENPGWDSYSQDEWLKIMRSAFDGYRGYQMRISVKSHNGWEKTITNYQARVNFANDLARLSEPYDGVELDLEWSYANQWETFGQLIDLIRDALPAGKTFMVSCHNVTYGFVPKNRYDKVDGFTFQQYGPQPTHFTWDTFVSKTQAFVNYGFPKSKIYVSYATTTSESNTGTAIQGIGGSKGSGTPGVVEADSYVPSDDVDTYTVAGQGTFTFTSPIQVYRRAQYATDNNLQGIFYWDMGNDVADYRQPYHYAKMASYGLNANVDRIVTDATPNHPEATGEKADDPDAQGENDVEDITRVTTQNKMAKFVDGAYIGFLAAQSGFNGIEWLGGDKNTVSDTPETPTKDAIFQLEAGEKGFYLRQVSTGKYVGRNTENGTVVTMYEDKENGLVGQFGLVMQTGTGSLYLNETNDLANLIDNTSTKCKALKLNRPADFGDGGNGAWKLWRVYTFSRKAIDAMFNDTDGVAAAKSDGSAASIYDLQGRRVQDARNGVFIVNGKKIVK